MSIYRSVFPVCVKISESNCVIRKALKEDMDIAAIEIPRAMNHFGQRGIEIFDASGSAFIMSQKSSRLD
jgi:hypothetical protein